MTIKKTLVFYKTSTYSKYALGGNRISKKHFYTHELHRFERTHKNHNETLIHVKKILDGLGVPYQLSRRQSVIDFSSFDLIITVGGDGTFLEAAQGITDQIILGVNSDPQWSVGRFCSAQVENFSRIMHKILNGKFHVRRIPRFSIKLDTGARPYHVLNDILIAHKNPAAMSRYYLTIGGKTEEQKSSGVWISTGAGSTGAVYSAGGKRIPEVTRNIQYRPRELYQGKRNVYRLRGGIVSLRKSFSVTSLMRDGAIYVDGAHVCIPFGFGRTVHLMPSVNDLKVVSGE